MPLEVRSCGGNKPTRRVNKRASGQQLYQEHLTRLRLKDRDLLDTPDGVVGPTLERGFTSAINPDDFNGRVVGFHPS